MNQWIAIAKIGGEAADAIVDVFRRWDAARTSVPEETDCVYLFAPEQWPPECRREMDSFARCLRENADRLPVVYYCEYVDMWSGGDVLQHLRPDDGGKAILAHGDDVELACYCLPDAGRLEKHLRRCLRKERIRERSAQEERWFVEGLLESCYAWQELADKAVLVVIRRVVGGSVEDWEVEDSLRGTPDWLGPFLGT
jgi:hypothetical protein